MVPDRWGEEDREDGGNSVCVGTEPCPECGSADNLKRYADGHAYCFSAGCGHREPPTKSGAGRPLRGGTQPRGEPAGGDLLKPDRPDAWDTIAGRRITSETMRRFGYFRGTFSNKTVHVAPYHDAAGQVVTQKLRFEDKGEGFPQLGGEPTTRCQLFGQRIWGSDRNRRVIVTEGELDCMAVAQATGFREPVVSVGGGAASARKHLMRNIDFLLRFEKIILWFDDDEAGRAATEECLGLFDPGKVLTIRTGDIMPGGKDACDVLVANRPGDILPAIYAAKPYIIPSIRSGRDIVNREEFLAASDDRLPLPFPSLTSVLGGGLKEREVAGIISGSGRGKSTLLFEVVAEWLMQGKRVGAMFFEDAAVDVMLGIMTAVNSQRYRMTMEGVDRAALYDQWMASDAADNLYLLDNEACEWSFESFMGYIRAMARACQCDVILVDPISFLAARTAAADERQQLDKAMAELAAVSKSLGVRVLYSHHVRKDSEDAVVEMGSLKGAGGFNQYSTLILALQPRLPDGSTPISCLKSRFMGEYRDRVLTYIDYDEATGRLRERPAYTPKGKKPARPRAADLPEVHSLYDNKSGGRGRRAAPAGEDAFADENDTF